MHLTPFAPRISEEAIKTYRKGANIFVCLKRDLRAAIGPFVSAVRVSVNRVILTDEPISSHAFHSIWRHKAGHFYPVWHHAARELQPIRLSFRNGITDPPACARE